MKNIVILDSAIQLSHKQPSYHHNDLKNSKNNTNTNTNANTNTKFVKIEDKQAIDHLGTKEIQTRVAIDEFKRRHGNTSSISIKKYGTHHQQDHQDIEVKNTKRTISLNVKNTKVSNHILYESQYDIISILYTLWKLPLQKEQEEPEEDQDSQKDISLRDFIQNLRISRKETYIHNIISNSKSNTIEFYIFLFQELERKRRGYISQDIEKAKKHPHLYNEENIISLNEILQILYETQGKCYYCECNCLLYYEKVRCNSQWTLDRLDNNKGHWSKNCVICCLSCNISRGIMDDDRFFKGKRMRIRKMM